MEGLFGGSKAGAAGKKGFDWGDAALGFFGVPVGQLATRRQKEREAEAAAAQQKQIADVIDTDPDLSPLDRQYAKANPEAYVKIRMERFKPLDSGAAGGSRGLPGPGGVISNWQTAPRFDDNGNIYGPGNGTSMPPILQRGTKAVSVAPEGTVEIRDAISGAPVMAGGSVAPQAPPPHVTEYLRAHPETADQFDQKYGPGSAARVLGGAGPQAPRTFPGF